MDTTTYAYARDHLAELWDEVENSQKPIVIQRRGHQDLALIPADELRSLEETVYLLRAPKNAVRLLAALRRSVHRLAPPSNLDHLRRELGLSDERRNVAGGKRDASMPRYVTRLEELVNPSG